MKLLFLIVACITISCVSAQGVDFLIDNLVAPLITDLGSNLTNFLISALLGLIGKRDLATVRVLDVLIQWFNQSSTQLQQTVQQILQGLQG
jgi:uncharacterized membrane protein YcfT